MPSCFVIQPFDRGAFDKRYEDVFSPSIAAAGLEPYRVDRDPGASIPIEQIESGIRAAAVCLADITADNPNVWFEVGFAIASGKELVFRNRSHVNISGHVDSRRRGHGQSFASYCAEGHRAA